MIKYSFKFMFKVIKKNQYQISFEDFLSYFKLVS